MESGSKDYFSGVIHHFCGIGVYYRSEQNLGSLREYFNIQLSGKHSVLLLKYTLKKVKLPLSKKNQLSNSLCVFRDYKKSPKNLSSYNEKGQFLKGRKISRILKTKVKTKTERLEKVTFLNRKNNPEAFPLIPPWRFRF